MVNIRKIGEALYCIDLDFQGQPHVIASYFLEDSGERALIEIGPTSTLDTLLAALQSIGVEPDTIAKVLVTHVHLDHAGASGTFLRRFPQAHLFVHENGAPHMIDPSRLLASAQRIYGDMMDTLWGEVEPVPANKLTTLSDNNSIAIGNRQLTALYTPGHASHHVAYHDPDREEVFTGDVAAVRIGAVRFVRPPTPPPDIDLELWAQSLQRLRELQPRALYLTHFGPSTEVKWHLQEAQDHLFEWAHIVERAVQSGQDRPEIVDTLRLHGDRQLLRLTNDASVLEEYELAAPYGTSVDGYLRYFKKRAQKAAAAST